MKGTITAVISGRGCRKTDNFFERKGSVADPDLQISGEGSGHPNFEIRGGPVLKKQIFRPFGPQFGPKIRGGPGPPGSSPGSTTEDSLFYEVKNNLRSFPKN